MVTRDWTARATEGSGPGAGLQLNGQEWLRLPTGAGGRRVQGCRWQWAGQGFVASPSQVPRPAQGWLQRGWKPAHHTGQRSSCPRPPYEALGHSLSFPPPLQAPDLTSWQGREAEDAHRGDTTRLCHPGSTACSQDSHSGLPGPKADAQPNAHEAPGRGSGFCTV